MRFFGMYDFVINNSTCMWYYLDNITYYLGP